MLIYFCELILPSTSVNVPTPSWVIHPQNIAENCFRPHTPRHSGRQISSDLLQIYMLLFWSMTTCVSSLKITFFQLLFTEQFNLPLHQFTRWVRFSEGMAKVFRVFLRVKLENLKRRLTVREEIKLGNFEFTSSVISFKVCRLFDFTHLRILRSPRASVFLGRQLRALFSLDPFRNFETPD